MDFWVPYQTIPFLRHQFWNLKQVDASPDLANVEPPQHDLKEDKCISWDERISTSLENHLGFFHSWAFTENREGSYVLRW